MMLDTAIDVSHLNGSIAWSAVGASGITVAMIKATQGAEFGDPLYQANNDAAIRAAIMVIPYHFLTSAPWRDQFANFQGVAASGAPIVALDWEGRQSGTLQPADVEAFGAALQAAGSRVLGYWGITGAAPSDPTQTMLGWDAWKPRYRFGKVPDFAHAGVDTPEIFCPDYPTLRFWQYTSGGVVPGISGYVDRSVANFDSLDDLNAWLGR